ncbi:MAG: hypothetical protein BGO78_12680 [Chloroflexi bacterium 44-23]|nr:MAG: hypothetical protein BGO78_12680 [Chloroflexi bacterium 44-23]
MLTSSPLLNIVLLSLMAGLGTSLGGLIAITRVPSRRSYGFLMGITAGVMISLSFLGLVNQAWELAGYQTATIGFAAGALSMFAIDFFAPHIRFGVREVRSDSSVAELPMQNCPRNKRSGYGFQHWGRQGMQRFRQRNHITNHKMLRTGMLLAIGITIHNIPEGIAVGAGYSHSPDYGVFIAMAILLHNIPEGIATALPLRTSGMYKWDAFWVATLSGLAEPIGALLAGLFLTQFNNFVPAALAFAGGVMIFITLDELIPTAREFGHHHTTALGIIIGSIFVFLLSGIFGI